MSILNHNIYDNVRTRVIVLHNDCIAPGSSQRINALLDPLERRTGAATLAERTESACLCFAVR